MHKILKKRVISRVAVTDTRDPGDKHLFSELRVGDFFYICGGDSTLCMKAHVLDHDEEDYCTMGYIYVESGNETSSGPNILVIPVIVEIVVKEGL